MAKKINITAQLNAATTEGILADAGQIFDAKKGKFQSEVNQEVEGRLVVADGEDLVTDGNVLRLKDRPNTDGMGYVILRKDKTFAEQVTRPNTIYEIRYDFDLGREELPVVLDTPFVLPSTGGAYYRTGDYINVEAGMTVDLPSGGVLFDSTLSAIIPAPYTPSSKKSLYVGKLQSEAVLGQSCVYSLEKEVVIPENCVLKFEGGSLGNGSLFFSNTEIEGTPVLKLNRYTGTIKNKEIEARWFRGSVKELKWLFDASESRTISLEPGRVYNIDYIFKFYSNSIIKGNNSIIVLDNTDEHVEDISFRLTNKSFSTRESETYDNNIKISDVKFIIGKNIGNCNILSFSHIKNLHIENISVEAIDLDNINNSRYCLDLYGDCENVHIYNSRFVNLSKSKVGLCLQIRSISGDSKNIFASGCTVIHSCLDEAIAVFANIHNLDNVKLSNFDVEYIKNELVSNGTLISVFSWDENGKASNIYFDNFTVTSNGLGHRAFGITLHPENVINANILNSSIVVKGTADDSYNNIVVDGDFKVFNCTLDIDYAKFVFNEAKVSDCRIKLNRGVLMQGSEIRNSFIDIKEALLYSYYGTRKIVNCVINCLQGNIATSRGATKACIFAGNILMGEPGCNIAFNGGLLIFTIEHNIFNNIDVQFNDNVINVLRGNTLNNSTISNKNEKYTEDSSIPPYWHIKKGKSEERPQAEDAYAFFDVDLEKPVFRYGNTYVDASGGKSAAYFVEHAKFDSWEPGYFDLSGKVAIAEKKQSSAYHSIKLEVRPGDKFNIKTVGNEYEARPYAITDLNLNIIKKGSGSINEEVTISDIGYLFINSSSLYYSSVTGIVSLPATFENIANKIEALNPKVGTWSQRPNADGSFLDNGFQYFLLESTPDTDPEGQPIESLTGNGKPIWWIQSSRKWVDAFGYTVTGGSDVVNKLLSEVNEVRHIINGEEYKFLTTEDESHSATIYAPSELENDGYVVVQQDNKAKFVDPADIGLK